MPVTRHVLHVAMECAPLAKAGGLADVVGALPGVQQRVRPGLVASVLMPWHAGLDVAPDVALRGAVLEGQARVGTQDLRYAVRRAGSGTAGHPVLLVDHPLFRGARLYAGGHELEKQALLAHAAVALARSPGALQAAGLPRVDLVHAHDFQPALACVLLRQDGLPCVPTVLTVHNARYQGAVEWDAASTLHLPASLPHGSADHDGRFNPLKAGLLTADIVTTVSPTHAEELRTLPAASHGLDYAFRMLGPRFVAILNGIDRVAWDPARDPHLASHFDAGDLSGKQRTKDEVCRLHGLDPARPLLVFVGRLVPEKGLDVLLDALPALAIAEPAAQVLVLGTGDRRYHVALAAAQRAPGSRVRAALRHDETLAHRVYAAADALLMPSWHEPCGLSQMYAQRYGAVPIVFPTGGLRDSVNPFDPLTGVGTGAWMDAHDASALVRAVARVLGWWRDPRTWAMLRANLMSADTSWETSVAHYLDCYDRAGLSA